MDEVNNKKHLTLTLVAVVTLLLLVAGATYAYFSVGATNNFNTVTANAQAGSIGSVTLNGTNANLTMALTASDMTSSNTNTYYASSSGKTTTETEVTIGTASVSPNTDTNYYHCIYTLSVTHTGTNDMYDKFNHKTNNTYDYTNRSTGQVALIVNGVEYDWASTNGMPSTIPGEFYIQGNETVDITAGLKFVNTSTDQSYMAGTDIAITIGIVNNSFTCSAEEEPVPASETIIGLASNNTCGITKYNGKVTDVYTDYGTGIDATNVYYLTNNNCNNVIFGGFCWKIIRTTETGRTKLLYNGQPDSVTGYCDKTGNDTMLTAAEMNTSSNTITFSQGGSYNAPAYVGYMYNATSGTYGDQLTANNVNVNDSLLKEKTEYWFQRSGIDESKLEDAVYCNDRSIASYSSTDYNSTSGTMYFQHGDSLACINETDAFSKGNSKAHLNYKAGFMTTSEKFLISNIVAANAQDYWLGTPSRYGVDDGAVETRVSSDGVGVDGKVKNSYGVRPVISVSSAVHISDGTGSTTEPFIFE